MKIKEIIKETHEDTIENLRNECSQTIDLMKKSKKSIYHCSNYHYQDIQKITPKTGRKPKSSPELFHNLTNEYLDTKGIKTNRGNSIFGFKEQVLTYGFTSYILFPVNNANVLWFKNSYDLFKSFYSYVSKNHDKFIDDLSENEIDKKKFNKFLDSLKPNTSLKKYLYNRPLLEEIMISSPLYIVKKEVFETDDFKKQIGLK